MAGHVKLPPDKLMEESEFLYGVSVRVKFLALYAVLAGAGMVGVWGAMAVLADICKAGDPLSWARFWVNWLFGPVI
jgi:hypothetical protein